MRSKKKAKATLIYTLALSLVAVFSASISTFAWFQATAEVNVETSSTSATITVSAPDDITITPTLYYYNLNGSTGYKPAANNATENAFTTSNFSAVASASDIALSNLHPGYRMSFMVKADAGSASMGSIVLTINSFSAASHAGVSAHREDLTNGGKITLARAIKIYTGYATTTSGHPTLGANQFSYTSSSTTKYEIFSQASGIGSIAYIYYTVEFSNDPACMYNEFSNNSAASVSNYVSETATTLDSQESSARYFRTAGSTTDFGSGDSNCYIGLRFTIPNLTISLTSI